MFRRYFNVRNAGSVGRVATGGGLVITYYQLSEIIKNRHQHREILQTHANHINNLEELIKNGVLDENTRNRLISERLTLKEKFDELIKWHNESINSGISDSAKEGFKRNFAKAAEEYDNIYDKTTDWLKNVKPKFLDDFSVSDNINELINSFKDYVTTLNVEQLLSLINILSACFILLSLFDIFLINLGNDLIDYFALEDKFPKLAKFIRLRKKITKYNNIINYLIIILALLFIIYVNLLVLTS